MIAQNSISACDSTSCHALGSVMKIQLPRNAPGLRRRERLVQYALRWVFRLSRTTRNLGLRVGLHHQPAHLMGEVQLGAPLRYLHMTPPSQRLAGQEQVAGASPYILVVLPPRAPALPGWADGHRPATGWRSRRSRPPALPDHRVRRTGPARPPCGPRSRRSPRECTTASSATA